MFVNNPGVGTPLTVFASDDDAVNSLTVLGSSDADTLRILPTVSGLLLTEGGGFAGTGSLPMPRKPLSQAFQDSGRVPDPSPALPVVFFDGGVGDDTIAIDLSGNGSTLARDVAYFTDANGLFSANNGDLNVQPESGAAGLTMTFTDVNGLAFTGGSLLVDATSTPATADIDVQDDVVPDDGVSMITADGGVATTLFDGLDSLTLRSGPGSESIDLISLDSSTSLSTLTLSGENTLVNDVSADTIHVHSLPATTAATLTGGAGNDILRLYNASSTVNAIEGAVVVHGDGGTDTLTIIDSGDSTGVR